MSHEQPPQIHDIVGHDEILCRSCHAVWMPLDECDMHNGRYITTCPTCRKYRNRNRYHAKKEREFKSKLKRSAFNSRETAVEFVETYIRRYGSVENVANKVVDICEEAAIEGDYKTAINGLKLFSMMLTLSSIDADSNYQIARQFGVVENKKSKRPDNPISKLRF